MDHFPMDASGLGDMFFFFENSWFTHDDMIINSAIFTSLVSCLERDLYGYSVFFSEDEE